MDRIVAVAVLGFLAACGGQSTQPSPPSPDGSASGTLKAAAAAAGKRVGVTVQAALLGDTQYRAALNRDFSDITPQLDMTWAAIESSRGVRNFSLADAVVDHASAFGQTVLGHVLVWHGSVPQWADSLDSTEFSAAFEAHIRAVVGRYAGRIHTWDVVSEAISDFGQGLRSSAFLNKLGSGYIAQAFRLAHEVDPQAGLFYHDHGADGGSRAGQIRNLVSDLVQQGVPIHGVGMKMPLNAQGYWSRATVSQNIRRLADLGLRVDMTELDIRIDTISFQDLTERLQTQRSVYQETVGACVQEPTCNGVSLAGLSDGQARIPNNGNDGPLLLNSSYGPKPAFAGVLFAFQGF